MLKTDIAVESTCMMGTGMVDCTTSAPTAYISSSDYGSGSDCTTGPDGEFVEICATLGCAGCPATSVDLSGWEIEDSFSNDEATETSVNITSGSLQPGECITIYSGYLNGDLDGSAVTASMGSTFNIPTSERDLCTIWNNSSDEIWLYDGDSQNGGNLIDMESYSSRVTTYTVPDAPTCPTDMGGTGTVSGGSIAATTCPAGSTAEYSTDGGTTWGAYLLTNQLLQLL